MLPPLRLRFALFALAGIGCALTPALLASGCGPQPTGVDACRKVESARCDAAAACGFTKGQIDDCKLFYQDQCLHGIENASHHPTDAEVKECVAAVQATGACAAAGITSMSACPDAPLVPDAVDLAPCKVLTSQVELLLACSFATATPDGGTTASTGSGTTTSSTTDTTSTTSDTGTTSTTSDTGTTTTTTDPGTTSTTDPADAGDGG